MPVETTAGGTKAGARWSLTALPLHRLEDRGGRDEVRSRSIARMVRLAALTAAACTHPEPAALAEVRQDYFLHCMGCHGENGAGLAGQVPDLRKDLARLAALPGGRAYVLRVPGVTQTTLAPELSRNDSPRWRVPTS